VDGREQYYDGDAQFDNAPYFNFNDDKVKFDTNDVDNANDNYGSASASVSKSLLKRNAPSSRGISLLLYRSYPTAEHSADLINRSLKREMLLAVDTLRLVHEANENAKEVELYARLLKYR